MNAEPLAKRPGGRSARVQAAVHQALTDLAGECDVTQLTIPAVAERAGVNPTTIYRRWGTLQALLAEVAALRGADAPPSSSGDLRTDLEAYAVRTLADLTRPGGIAFFQAEVSPDIDERRSGLRECLRRATVGLDMVLAASRERGETPPPTERLLDRIVAPLYFRVVFSVPDTDETYARALVADLFSGTWHTPVELR
ncbi:MULTISPECIES: TetR/AcrR family transcriptional regulator [unclassified Streptomyces]|uniref:TetR/AcrR family transcriptional regulator n=1 Tax=unclassified Streptomyces TaxID=2593676 RepID=UPI000DBAD56B|nr:MULTISPECIES: TetR/AcrR family transcriptional regulator [unclassified Streptomyces]MYU07337.1 TetR family transcriptional regulator [Streptomyces sp. SID8366]MYU65385.1 TetR family transcriptional regulator [Streptomyces sp. SID69]RAJ61591.1 TetR family transcriptional regulator [Streptomyces sp. PsTaAH-130]